MGFNFEDEKRPSLAGFGYQDPEYSAYDGMSSPGYMPLQSYSSSEGQVIAKDPLTAIQQAAAKSNAWSAEQAANQNAFQVQQNEKAMQFSAEQAALNRSWQEEMSNTAHQREVTDLVKAGLNPVLSATGGNGASVGSGATAAGVTSAGAKGDTDESLTMALMSYFAQLVQAQTAVMNTQTSANATLANAEMMSSASRYAADLNYTLGMNDMNHVAGSVVSGVLDPFGQGVGNVANSSAQKAADKVKTWLSDVYNAVTENEPAYLRDGVTLKGQSKGGSTVNERNGSHSSGKWQQSDSATAEKAVGHARVAIENALQSSGLNLIKAIDKATNGNFLSKKFK